MSANGPPPASEPSTGKAAVKALRPRKRKAAALPKPPPIADEEHAAPMSELPHVHAPQQGIHSWRDFVVHIAVVTIGLLLAIGLQQVVEAVHDRSERAHLEEQMHETFVANAEMIVAEVQMLENFQGYLADLRSAVSAQIAGRPGPPAPAQSDPRNFTYIPPPSLGAYEAAKANGTVALLSFDTIRLYDRLGMTIEIMQNDLQRYLGASNAMRAFAERFGSARVSPYSVPPVNLTDLSAAELIEYRVLIGNMIGAAEAFKNRLRILGLSGRAILDGVHTEAELREAIAKLPGNAPSAPAVGAARDRLPY